MTQGRKAERIKLTERQEDTLKKIVSTRVAKHRYHQRATIILRAAKEESNQFISNEMNINRGDGAGDGLKIKRFSVN